MIRARLADWAVPVGAEAERYIEEQKRTEHVEPIRPIPVKPEYPLYTHQIRGYNIALALMGYAPEEDCDVDRSSQM